MIKSRTRTLPPTYARPIDEAYERIEALKKTSPSIDSYLVGITDALGVVSILGGQKPSKMLLTPQVETNPFEGMKEEELIQCQYLLGHLRTELETFMEGPLNRVLRKIKEHSPVVEDLLKDELQDFLQEKIELVSSLYEKVLSTPGQETDR